VRRRTFVLVASLLLVAACSDDDNPAAPSNNTQTYALTLLPSNEVPPVTNADATASGTATVTLNLTRDAAGTITAATADFLVTLTGFPANTTVVGAHIHTGAAGANGSVVVNLGLSSANSVSLPAGGGTISRTAIPVDAALAQAIVASPTSYYFNVHTILNPSGAVRGQL